MSSLQRSATSVSVRWVGCLGGTGISAHLPRGTMVVPQAPTVPAPADRQLEHFRKILTARNPAVAVEFLISPGTKHPDPPRYPGACYWWKGRLLRGAPFLARYGNSV